MARIADRVAETSTTTGTGALTLDGAIVGFDSFDGAFGTGSPDEPFHYVIEGIDGDSVGEWAVGTGYLSDATTLVRTDGYDLSSGTKRVFCAATAEYLNEGSPSASIVLTTHLRGAVGFTGSTNDDTETPLNVAYPYNGVLNAPEIATQNDEVCCLKATVTACDATNGDAAFFEITAVFQNTAGTVAILGTPTITTIHATAGAGTWAVDVDVSGASILVNVTGAAATDIQWGGGGVLHSSVSGA